MEVEGGHWLTLSWDHLSILTGFSCFVPGSSHSKPPHSATPVIFSLCGEKVLCLVSPGSFLLQTDSAYVERIFLSPKLASSFSPLE